MVKKEKTAREDTRNPSQSTESCVRLCPWSRSVGITSDWFQRAFRPQKELVDTSLPVARRRVSVGENIGLGPWLQIAKSTRALVLGESPRNREGYAPDDDSIG
jgi:hypothetical protein